MATLRGAARDSSAPGLLLNKTRNDGNICRAARWHGIDHPRQYDMTQLDQLYRIAKDWKKNIKQQAKFLRKTHLRECRARAQAQRDLQKANDIWAIMLQEQSSSMWGRINRVTQPPHAGALMSVEREIDGQVVEFTEEEALVDNILDVIRDRYSGAEDAPISNCSITDKLGDFGFTELGLKIISGEFELPDNLRESTIRVLRAIGDIGSRHMDDNIDPTLLPERYCGLWGRAREATSSSMSGLHFGHYIASTGSKLISRSMARKISLHSKLGHPPDRWLNVLMVMLEKKLSVRLIPKLRAILLKEADHNLHDGFVFGSLMLDHARENGLVPEEQLAEKAKTAEDGVWIKVLKADYARLKREALGIIAADAANCYDMVNHLILALLLRAIGIPFGPIISMLLSIKLMRYYLRTGFGESKRAMCPEDSTRRCHGLNQGSRAAPPCWTVISSISLYSTRGDSFGPGPADSGTGVNRRLWDDTGDWHYNSLLADDGHELTVPTREGREAIDLFPVHVGKETLGVFTAPDGNSQDHLAKIVDKVKTWVARISTGRLPASYNWNSYIYQLWMGVRYGIGALPADRDEIISGFLHETDRSMLPFLGVNRNIRTG
ncbi:hypothetical protein ACHAWO_002522 [Cyclotella atomus]|uniref:Reverse transcriptase domain-containing protein n=1 Tax=Cyclotella atomus TaxID=382360 RepID=A0ABD3N8V5_9STRA